MLRRWMRGDPADQDEVQASFDVVVRFRAVHQDPLSKATMGLRSVVRTVGCSAEVSQRLKRIPTILDKLGREPSLALSRMQDFGGCRAVLASIDDLRLVEQRLKKNRPPLRHSDYVTAPRASGYRGVHVVVGYLDGWGERRSIEVQLRTRVMHEWAITVERLSGRLAEDLKSERGPQEVVELLRVISEAMAIEESGGLVPSQLAQMIERRREAALPYLLRRTP